MGALWGAGGTLPLPLPGAVDADGACTSTLPPAPDDVPPAATCTEPPGETAPALPRTKGEAPRALSPAPLLHSGSPALAAEAAADGPA